MRIRTFAAAAALSVVTVSGIVAAAVPSQASASPRPGGRSCQSGLRVVQLVARQTEMNIGTDRLPFQGATPAQVAAELRHGAGGQGEPLQRYMLSAAAVAADLAAHERHGRCGGRLVHAGDRVRCGELPGSCPPVLTATVAGGLITSPAAAAATMAVRIRHRPPPRGDRDD